MTKKLLHDFFIVTSVTRHTAATHTQPKAMMELKCSQLALK